MYERQQITVGSVTSNSVSITEGSVWLPGPTQQIPQTAEPYIQISMLWVNEDYFTVGSDICIAHVNESRDILPNHEYRKFRFDPLPWEAEVEDYMVHYSAN